jgi:hypothetical protein
MKILAIPQRDRALSATARRSNLLRVKRANIPPYLTTVSEKKVCSVCGLEFPKDSKPSVSRAFAEHVRKIHKKKVRETPD